MVVFTKRDREVSHAVYEDLADAVASAVARREAAPGPVHVAAYQHRFGIDLTVHANRELAERRLADIAAREAVRDPMIRGRVQDRFGVQSTDEMSADDLDALLTAWPDLSDGEALWIVECEVEMNGGRAPRPVVLPATTPVHATTEQLREPELDSLAGASDEPLIEWETVDAAAEDEAEMGEGYLAPEVFDGTDDLHDASQEQDPRLSR